MGAEILAISIDTVFSHKVWNEGELARLVEGGLPYPMLADPAGKLGRIYGVFDEEGCVNLRGRFIIDPDGVLKAAEILDSSVGRNIDEILRQLVALQHVRQSGGVHVCPVNWAFGDLDMTPGPDEVGHAGEHWKSELEE